MPKITFYDVIEIINVIPEILIMAFYHQRILKMKYSYSTPYICGYFLAFICLTVATIMVTEPRIRILVTFTILIITSTLLYSDKMVMNFFSSLYYIAGVLISETLFVGILMLMGYGNPADLLSDCLGRVIGIVGSKIFDFWLIVYSCRIYKNKIRSLPLKYWLLILIMPFLSAVILDLIFPKNTSDIHIISFFLFTICGLLYLNLSVFNYFESYEKQIKLASLEKIVEREDENYRMIENSYEEIRNLKHDLKNQTEILNNMLQNQEYTDAQNYIRKLIGTIENAASVCYTGNSAIDSIINIKGAYAWSSGIKFMTKINVDKIAFDRVELCRILGNALDNAIEACNRIKTGEKCICFIMKTCENKLIIEVSNTSMPVDIYNLTTSKANKAIHGIGLQSIKCAVSNLNGHVSFGYENGFFFIKIVLVR